MKPAFAAFSALAVSLLAPWCFPAQSPGLPPEWDVRDMLAGLTAQEAMAESMVDAVRRYQNPAVADLIQDLINENAKYTQQLRDYLVELVAAKEAECKIANQEAQRCRSELIRQPAKPSPARGPRQ